jgi:hypothetical protein
MVRSSLPSLNSGVAVQLVLLLLPCCCPAVADCSLDWESEATSARQLAAVWDQHDRQEGLDATLPILSSPYSSLTRQGSQGKEQDVSIESGHATELAVTHRRSSMDHPVTRTRSSMDHPVTHRRSSIDHPVTQRRPSLDRHVLVIS